MTRWDLYNRKKYCTCKDASEIYGISEEEFQKRLEKNKRMIKRYVKKTIMRGEEKINLYDKREIMELFVNYLTCSNGEKLSITPVKKRRVNNRKNKKVAPDGYISYMDAMSVYSMSRRELRTRIEKYTGRVDDIYVRRGSVKERYFNAAQLKEIIESFKPYSRA